jgi:hypothetical protein
MGDQFRGQSGEQLFQGLLAARRQRMKVATVGDAAPVPGCFGQLIPIDHRHLPVAIAEHSGGEQPCHACADHHGVVSGLLGHSKLPGCAQWCSA